MMRCLILAVGFLKNGPEYDLCSRYHKRFSNPPKILEFETCTDVERYISRHIKSSEFIVVLDERGEALNSIQFSKLIHKQPTIFVIGGHDGVSIALKARAKKMICFGQLTWPHLLMRSLLMEQLYRSVQIQQNHPYHRE